MTGFQHPAAVADQSASEGPAWAPQSLDVQGGRFPLSVEAHLLNMTASLVPGATTVTTSARYYTLHGTVALEAERRKLEVEERLELLRRCEVVMAAASIVHPSSTAGTVHGYDAIVSKSGGTTFDIDRLSTPKTGYSDARTGFLGPYLGSELTLGILDSPNIDPGKRLAGAGLDTSFDGMFDLAAQSTVTDEQLSAAQSLSVGALTTSDDGEWLARQLCAVDLPEMGRSDQIRAGTVQLLVRSALLSPSPSIVESFRQVVAYGPSSRNDPVIARVPEAEPWRGALFRHDSVGAWRQLWAWMVDAIEGPTRRSELVDKLADTLPEMTLGEFDRQLPVTVDTFGDPVDAESQLRQQQRPLPSQALGLVMLGARRAHELVGTTRAALVGNEQRVAVLSPLWVGEWVDNRRHLHMRDVARELTGVLLDRALRIAASKSRLRNGRMWLPSMIGERGEFLYRVGREGRGNVGLRLEQLAGLLRGVGVLESSSFAWTLGPRGVALLGSVA